MSFEIIRKTGEIAFVANPIAFEVKTSGEAEIEIRLRVGAQEVFSASYVPFGDRIHFDIAEILQPFVTSGPLEDSEDLILPVSGFMAGYTLEVKGRETRTLTGKVICGGDQQTGGKGNGRQGNGLYPEPAQGLFIAIPLYHADPREAYCDKGNRGLPPDLHSSGQKDTGGIRIWKQNKTA